MKTTPCKTCREPVITATSISNEPMILDAEPVIGGSVWLEEHVGGVRAHVLSPKALAALGGPQFVPHFAACRDQQLRRESR